MNRLQRFDRTRWGLLIIIELARGEADVPALAAKEMLRPVNNLVVLMVDYRFRRDFHLGTAKRALVHLNHLHFTEDSWASTLNRPIDHKPLQPKHWTRTESCLHRHTRIKFRALSAPCLEVLPTTTGLSAHRPRRRLQFVLVYSTQHLLGPTHNKSLPAFTPRVARSVAWRPKGTRPAQARSRSAQKTRCGRRSSTYPSAR